uniref:Uncharacterized protein n=1 Tax=Zea mays TaxID=4577 RepID=A0A804PHV6_MAIZE
MLAYSNRRPSLSSRSPPSSLLPPRRPPPRSSTRLPPTQISGALSSLRREQGRRLPWHRREPGVPTALLPPVSSEEAANSTQESGGLEDEEL